MKEEFSQRPQSEGEYSAAGKRPRTAPSTSGAAMDEGAANSTNISAAELALTSSSGEFRPWPEHSARPPPPTPDARVMSPIVRGVHRFWTRARSFFARFLFIRNQGRERVESGS